MLGKSCSCQGLFVKKLSFGLAAVTDCASAGWLRHSAAAESDDHMNQPFSLCLPLQNPVSTIVWLVANYSLLAPLTTFSQDIKLFAIPLQQRKPQLLMAVAFMVLAYLAILCGPATHANFFHLYVFPVSFRLQVAGVVLAQFSVCACVLIGVKALLAHLL